MSHTEKVIPQNVFIPLALDVTHFLSPLGELGARGDGGKRITNSLLAKSRREARLVAFTDGQWQLAVLWPSHTLFSYNSCTTPSLYSIFHRSLGRTIRETYIGFAREKENNTLRGKKKGLFEMKSGFLVYSYNC